MHTYNKRDSTAKLGLPCVIIMWGRILSEIHLLYQDKKVHMIAVGIGEGIKDSELEKLAGHKGDSLHPEDFNDLAYILGKMKDEACGMILILRYIVPCNIHQRINTLDIFKITLK